MGVFSKALHFLFDSSISEPYAGIYRYIYIYIIDWELEA